MCVCICIYIYMYLYILYICTCIERLFNKRNFPRQDATKRPPAPRVTRQQYWTRVDSATVELRA